MKEETYQWKCWICNTANDANNLHCGECGKRRWAQLGYDRSRAREAWELVTPKRRPRTRPLKPKTA